MKACILISACLLISACATRNDKEGLKELDTMLSEEFKPDQPGGSVLVKKGDSIVFLKSYGLADLETKEKITENTVFEYSNPAFNGLALIIEKVTGQPWQKFVSESILAPAGMLTSKITDGPYPEAGVAHAYSLKNGRYTEDDYGEFPTFAAAGNGGARNLCNQNNP